MSDNKVKSGIPAILETDSYKVTHNISNNITHWYYLTRAEVLPEGTPTRISLKKNRYKNETGV